MVGIRNVVEMGFFAGSNLVGPYDGVASFCRGDVQPKHRMPVTVQTATFIFEILHTFLSMCLDPYHI
jgi:hypothetical protein